MTSSPSQRDCSAVVYSQEACLFKRFSRQAKLETLLKYDDNRVDEAGAIARMLGKDSEQTE